MSSSYRDLLVRQRAIELMIELYRCTSRFPNDELYGLRKQLREVAGLLLTNIAEGQKRPSASERKTLSMAMGALPKIESQIHIAYRMSYLSHEQVLAILSKTGELFRILSGLMLATGKEPMASQVASAASASA